MNIEPAWDRKTIISFIEHSIWIEMRTIDLINFISKLEDKIDEIGRRKHRPPEKLPYPKEPQKLGCVFWGALVGTSLLSLLLIFGAIVSIASGEGVGIGAAAFFWTAITIFEYLVLFLHKKEAKKYGETCRDIDAQHEKKLREWEMNRPSEEEETMCHKASELREHCINAIEEKLRPSLAAMQEMNVFPARYRENFVLELIRKIFETEDVNSVSEAVAKFNARYTIMRNSATPLQSIPIHQEIEKCWMYKILITEKGRNFEDLFTLPVLEELKVMTNNVCSCAIIGVGKFQSILPN